MRRLLAAAAAAAPPSPGAGRAGDPRGRGAYGGDTNFDTNMVIILAALLCALICALGLNSIVRCALRCGRRMAFETPEEAAARLAGTGLKKRTLRQIPVAVYGQGASIPATECPICLGEFADGEKVRVLPRCNHGFHVRCIDTWLASHSSCPTCRHSLLDRAAGGREEGRSQRNSSEVAGGAAAATIALGQDHSWVCMPRPKRPLPLTAWYIIAGFPFAPLLFLFLALKKEPVRPNVRFVANSHGGVTSDTHKIVDFPLLPSQSSQ